MCALVGVLIKCLYEMHGATIKKERMTLGRHVARTGERLHGRTRRRWDDKRNGSSRNTIGRHGLD